MMALENQVDIHVPPAFIWHTFEDQSVPFQNSLLFVEAMGKAGVPANSISLPKKAAMVFPWQMKL